MSVEKEFWWNGGGKNLTRAEVEEGRDNTFVSFATKECKKIRH